MKPRDYQQAAIDSVWSYFKTETGNPIIAMPPGTGKSIVIAGLLKQIYARHPNQRIMMLTHVKELIVQNYDKLTTLWPAAPCGIYSAGLRRKEIYQSITFAGIGSVAKKSGLFGHIDLIVIDEAHLVSPNQNTMYQKFITDLKVVNPMLKIIGLTATPYRLSHGMLADKNNLFTDVCFDMTTLLNFNWLVTQGYLVPLIAKKTALLLDTDDVGMRGGEFIASDLQLAVDRDEITRIALEETIAIASDRKKWLVFTTGIDHTIHTNKILNELGIKSLPVHSGNKDHKFTTKERDLALSEFANGNVQALVNPNILTTGYDLPDIDLIVVLRPSQSVGLWVQILGRGTRPVYASGYDLTTREGRLQAIQSSDKHNCLVLDFAANTARLGPINDPVLPSKKNKKGGGAPVKVCDNCECYIHASLKLCLYCGYEFTFAVHLNTEASNIEVMRDIEPVEPDIIERFDVDHIVYSLHKKIGKPDSVKVNYYCKLRMFTEYICFEHEGYARKKAERWWTSRTDLDIPDYSDAALELGPEILRVAKKIGVVTNKKYPQVIDYFF